MLRLRKANVFVVIHYTISNWDDWDLNTCTILCLSHFISFPDTSITYSSFFFFFFSWSFLSLCWILMCSVLEWSILKVQRQTWGKNVGISQRFFQKINELFFRLFSSKLPHLIKLSIRCLRSQFSMVYLSLSSFPVFIFFCLQS